MIIGEVCGRPWRKRDQKIAITMAIIMMLITVTAAFLGFPGWNSVNLLALYLAGAALGLALYIGGTVAEKFSNSPVWVNLKKGGWIILLISLFVASGEIKWPNLH